MNRLWYCVMSIQREEDRRNVSHMVEKLPYKVIDMIEYMLLRSNDMEFDRIVFNLDVQEYRNSSFEIVKLDLEHVESVYCDYFKIFERQIIHHDQALEIRINTNYRHFRVYLIGFNDSDTIATAYWRIKLYNAAKIRYNCGFGRIGQWLTRLPIKRADNLSFDLYHAREDIVNIIFSQIDDEDLREVIEWLQKNGLNELLAVLLRIKGESVDSAVSGCLGYMRL